MHGYLDKFKSDEPTQSTNHISRYSFWNRHRHHSVARKLAVVTSKDQEKLVWIAALDILFGTQSNNDGAVMHHANTFSTHGWLVSKVNKLFETRFSIEIPLARLVGKSIVNKSNAELRNDYITCLRDYFPANAATTKPRH